MKLEAAGKSIKPHPAFPSPSIILGPELRSRGSLGLSVFLAMAAGEGCGQGRRQRGQSSPSPGRLGSCIPAQPSSRLGQDNQSISLNQEETSPQEGSFDWHGKGEKKIRVYAMMQRFSSPALDPDSWDEKEVVKGRGSNPSSYARR